MSLMYDALRTLEAAPGTAPAPALRARVERRYVGIGVVGVALVAGLWGATTAFGGDDAVPPVAATARVAHAESSAMPRDRDDVGVAVDNAPTAATPAAVATSDAVDARLDARDAAMASSNSAATVAASDLIAASNLPRVAKDTRQDVSVARNESSNADIAQAKTSAAGPATALAIDVSDAPVQKTGAVQPVAATPAPEADASTVQRAVADLDQAIRARDLQAARARLGTLAALLPADSLTLLRMRTWVAHEGGDTDGALAGYREIARRLPGDRAATINLAALEAQQGDIGAARERLQTLRAQSGGSPELDAAMARVGGAP